MNKKAHRRWTRIFTSFLAVLAILNNIVQASGSATPGSTEISSFVDVAINQDQPIGNIKAEQGKPIDQLGLPDILQAYTEENGILQEIDVPVSWECPGYDADTPGSYTFYAQLEEEYQTDKIPHYIIEVISNSPVEDSSSTVKNTLAPDAALYGDGSYNSEPPAAPGLNIQDYFTLGYDCTIDSQYNNVALITRQAKNQKGMMWAHKKLDLTRPFTLEMYVYQKPDDGVIEFADGMTFTMHNDSRGNQAVAQFGSGLGVYGKDNYIKNALTTEFDTYFNSDTWHDSKDPDQYRGTGHLAITRPTDFLIPSGHLVHEPMTLPTIWKKCIIDWQTNGVSGTLTVTLNDESISYSIGNVKMSFKSNYVWWGFTGSTGTFASVQAAAITKLPQQDDFTVEKSGISEGKDVHNQQLAAGDIVRYSIKTSVKTLFTTENWIVEDTLSPDLEYLGNAIVTTGSGQSQSILPETQGAKLRFNVDKSLVRENDEFTISFNIKVKESARGKEVKNFGLIRPIDDTSNVKKTNEVLFQVKSFVQNATLSGNKIAEAMPQEDMYEIILTVSGTPQIVNENTNEHTDFTISDTLSEYVQLIQPQECILEYRLKNSQAKWTVHDDSGVVDFNTNGTLNWIVTNYSSDNEYRIRYLVEVKDEHWGKKIHKDQTSGKSPEQGTDGVIANNYTYVSSSLAGETEILVPTVYKSGISVSIATQSSIDNYTGLDIGDNDFVRTQLAGVAVDEIAQPDWDYRIQKYAKGVEHYVTWRTKHENVILKSLSIKIGEGQLQPLYLSQNPDEQHFVYTDPSCTAKLQINNKDIIKQEDKLIFPELRESIHVNISFQESIPFSFIKVGEDYTTALQGAEFVLYQCHDTSAEHVHSIFDKQNSNMCWKELITKSSSSEGIVDFGRLASGQYLLVETKVPIGYEQVLGYWTIKVDASASAAAQQILIVQEGGQNIPAFLYENNEYRLPNLEKIFFPPSGELGQKWLIFIGITFIILAGILFIFNRMKRHIRR